MTTAIVYPERLALLDALTLDKGHHRDFAAGHCAMEVVSWLAGEGFTDAPECASPVLTRFCISLNDTWDAGTRQRLVPYLPRMVGTAGDGQDEERSYLALDWQVRVYTPAWFDLAGLRTEAAALRGLRPIVDMSAAKEAGPVVRDSRDKAVAAWAAVWAAAGAAAKVAAWDAAWDAAGDAAKVAAGDAAKVAAKVAAWDAAWVAAWDAAGAAVCWDAVWAAAATAAWDAAKDAAWDAVWDAAWDALRPTVDALQTSALDLLDRMIDPAARA